MTDVTSEGAALIKLWRRQTEEVARARHDATDESAYRHSHETPEQRCPAGGVHESDHYICTKCGLKTFKIGHALKADDVRDTYNKHAAEKGWPPSESWGEDRG